MCSNSKIKFGLVAVRRGESVNFDNILHFIGFVEKPTLEDVEFVRETLVGEEVFGLCGVDFELIDSPLEIVNYYSEII